jgi:DNA helicase HerA-like ATPase
VPMALRISREFSLPAEAVSETFAILAKRGAGKTYTAAVLVEELLKAGLHVVVVDPVGVWRGLRASADGQGEGLPIVILGGDYGDVPLEVGAGELIADLVVEEGLSVVLDLSIPKTRRRSHS